LQQVKLSKVDREENSCQLLIYIDPGFLEDVGHYQNFANNIQFEAGKRGVALWHCVNRDVNQDVVRRLSLMPVFNYKAVLRDKYRVVGKAREATVGLRQRLISGYKLQAITNKQILRSFSKTLREILNEAKMANYKDVYLYMYTSHPLYIPVFASQVNAPELASMNLTAHLDLFYLNRDFCNGFSVPGYERLLRRVSKELVTSDSGCKVHLYSDSNRVIRIFQPFFERSIKPIPIPLIKNSTVKASGEDARAQKKVVGFFGYAHKKQGYHLVSQLYRRLVSCSQYNDVHFIVRHNTKFASKDIEPIIADFRRRTERITHLDASMSEEEYRSWLSKCDVVLIPHSKEYYPCQTSGLLVDALAVQKLVVVPDNTWLSDEVKKYRAGTVFRSDDIQSFISAVGNLLLNYDGYYKSRKDTTALMKYHSASSLFNTLGIGE
jgi:glycosyltransferase involved in cell wall biosynthesis